MNKESAAMARLRSAIVDLPEPHRTEVGEAVAEAIGEIVAGMVADRAGIDEVRRVLAEATVPGPDELRAMPIEELRALHQRMCS
jgi:hypothetical protein